MIKVPVATATDAVDGETEVKVSVAFGLTPVTLTNGEFRASEYGTYIITYSATDDYGNTAMTSFYVEVQEDVQSNDENTDGENISDKLPNVLTGCNGCNGGTGCNGCNGSISGGIGIIGILLTSGYLLRKKRENNDKKE